MSYLTRATDLDDFLIFQRLVLEAGFNYWLLQRRIGYLNPQFNLYSPFIYAITFKYLLLQNITIG